jgi:hypothetical protein
MYAHGIKLTCPSEALGTEPIPVEVEICGDMRTYWDNDGIIDKALTVALLRRDRPGLRFLDKIDPGLIMLPDKPLPGRPSDETLDADPAMVRELKTLDAAPLQPAQLGTAEYLVTGAFSKWWAGIRDLRVLDPKQRVRPPATLRLGFDGQPLPVRPCTVEEQAQLRASGVGDGCSLVVPIKAGLLQPEAWTKHGQPWLTIVGFKLCPQGGGCGGIFALETVADGAAGQVLVPVSMLSVLPLEGDWLFLGLVGNELLPPSEIRLEK